MPSLTKEHQREVVAVMVVITKQSIKMMLTTVVISQILKTMIMETILVEEDNHILSR